MENQEKERLPISFHQTFIPERRYITAFLRFATGGNGGSDQHISEQTGIPVGQSSGKVPAIIRYCSGMGLTTTLEAKRVEERKFALTPFGRSVLLEDPNLSESLTQWLLHFHLCRQVGGAEIWFQCFTKGFAVLGMEFSEDKLTEFLVNTLGVRNRSLRGPLIGTYEESAALKNAGILQKEQKIIRRFPAPLLSGFQNGYSAFLLSLWDYYFSDEVQLTADDFEEKTSFCKIAGWDARQYETVLEMIETAGAIRLDKQMRPWVLSRSADTEKFWTILFDDLA